MLNSISLGLFTQSSNAFPTQYQNQYLNHTQVVMLLMFILHNLIQNLPSKHPDYHTQKNMDTVSLYRDDRSEPSLFVHYNHNLLNNTSLSLSLRNTVPFLNFFCAFHPFLQYSTASTWALRSQAAGNLLTVTLNLLEVSFSFSDFIMPFICVLPPGSDFLLFEWLFFSQIVSKMRKRERGWVVGLYFGCKCIPV